MITMRVLSVRCGSIIDAVRCETVSLVGFDEHALRARVVDHVFVGDPVRNRDDHLIAGIKQHLQRD